jgi:hypothetical protein
MRALRLAAMLAAFATVLAMAACDSEESVLSTEAIVSSIPWAENETLNYRLLDGDKLEGSGVLIIEPKDGASSFRQRYANKEFIDEVRVAADSETLRPHSVERVLTGPQGERRWAVNYGERSAQVTQRSESDEREDLVSLPANAYDSWTDIFLWRTIDFREGYEATYTDVLSATLSEPRVISQTLKVTGKQEVIVPAGVVQAWRLEVHAPDGDQVAWYADTPERPLVKYDNGSLIFELLSFEQPDESEDGGGEQGG